MRCDLVRESLSARLDAEPAPLGDDIVQHHLAGCPACRAWAAEASRLHRTTHLRPAEPVPDLVGAIMATAPRRGPSPRLAARGWLREGLVFVGVLLVAVGLGGVLSASPAAGHTPAWDLAFGAGLLVVAWQPHRAHGLLPMAGVLVLAMTGASALHLANGHPIGHEPVVHALELLGVLLLWGMGRIDRPGAAGARAVSTA